MLIFFICQVHPLSWVPWSYNYTLYLYYDPSEEEDTSSVISLSELLSHATLRLATTRTYTIKIVTKGDSKRTKYELRSWPKLFIGPWLPEFQFAPCTPSPPPPPPLAPAPFPRSIPSPRP